MRRRAYREHRENCMALIQEGLKKYNGPFQILTPLGPKVVLPAEYHEWVRTSQDVSHQAYVAHEFFADVPGFDGQAMISNPDQAMIRITTAKLSQNADSIPIMCSALLKALDEHWTQETEWHTLEWQTATQALVSHMAAAIFAGPRLGLTKEWQALTARYVNAFFVGVFKLMEYPRWMARVAPWVMGSVKTCRETLDEMRALVDAELRERESEERGGRKRKGDLIDWTRSDAVARGRREGEVDHAVMQAAFAIAALHTTSEALRQTLLDICTHPELVEPLRDEISRVVKEEGGCLTHAGLQKMVLLDSVMKESQRMASASVSLERHTLRPTTLPNNLHLPRGTTIGVAATDMWTDALHTSPTTFDGCRYLRLREGDKSPSHSLHGTKCSYVASTKEHNTFGTGKFICPGRFFAANEVKIAICYILTRYEIGLEEGAQVQGFRNAYFFISEPGARVKARRREGGGLGVLGGS